jgi:DNA-binding MarR family transcriptional regulator
MHLTQVTRPADLTALQYTALTVLERHPDQTASELARHSFVTAQSAAEMVAALIDRGLVQRHRDTVDRRRLVIALTLKGQQVLDEIRPHVHDLEERMLAGIAPASVEVLRQALHSCDLGLNEEPDAPTA